LEHGSDIPCRNIHFHSLNWVASPMSNSHPGGPGFVFWVFFPTWLSFCMLIEVFSPWFSFRVFLPLAFWVSSPHHKAAVAVLAYWPHLIARSRPSWRI
jgi:hypothetical protein